MFDSIVSALGGRIAEQLFLDDISTGASNDIQQATNIARDMVMKYGMSEKLGPISFDDSSHSIFIGRDFGTTKSYSEETAVRTGCGRSEQRSRRAAVSRPRAKHDHDQKAAAHMRCGLLAARRAAYAPHTVRGNNDI